MDTYNFRKEDYKYEHPILERNRVFDYRNNITCINPSLNLECYVNYIQYLNDNKQFWKTYGYLHLGMMPAAMAPSFMQRKVVEEMSHVLNKLNIPYYSLPPVCFLSDICRVKDNDIWVFREDAAKAMNKPNVTMEQFVRWCLR